MINYKHSADELASIFAANKSLVIDDFLEPTLADSLYNWFNAEIPPEWWFASFKNPGFEEKQEKNYKDVKYLQRTEQNKELIDFELKKCNYSLSKGHFSYMFDRTTAHKPTCPCPECNFVKNLNSTTVLDFLSAITGEQLTHTNETFASKFMSGEFLGPHHDLNKGKIGFILNLTKDWRPEYGGLLHFLTDDYKQVTKVVLPEFNKLTLFSIPKKGGIPHYVSHVNPGVELNRISYTGWFS
tara:strand:- start:436 stop:1158 length:723 start_codon:yes stop_codon:yes gene_type:complete